MSTLLHEQDQPPAPAQGTLQCPARPNSSPQGGPSGPRMVRGKERVCGETGGEMGALISLIPAAVLPSCFESLLLLPAIVGSRSPYSPISPYKQVSFRKQRN